MSTNQKIFVGVGVIFGVALIGLLVWFVFLRGTQSATNPGATIKNSQSFSTVTNTPTQQTTPLTTSGQEVDTSGINSEQKIFKIADGPVLSATFIETYGPTTTLARYVMQDSGHVFDIPVSVSGALARVVSNITIPGLGSGTWTDSGGATILQYLEASTMKTLYLGFPSAASTTASSSPTIRFFPDNITGLAASPDGSSVVYLLAGGGGTVGYVSKNDGTGSKVLFTLPFSQVTVSWPSIHTLLVQTKEATGVPGIAFSVSTAGAISPLLYANSLSALANVTFSKIVYQSTTNTTAARNTYIHDVPTGIDGTLPFNPLPEKCVWGTMSTSTMYCAAPLSATPTNYLDLWHQGLTSVADDIFSFDVDHGVTTMVANPGGAQGGVAADMAQVAVSPDGQYLLYITRGDRTLWGVHIGH